MFSWLAVDVSALPSSPFLRASYMMRMRHWSVFREECEGCVATFLGELVPHLMRCVGKGDSLDLRKQSRELRIDHPM